MSDQTVIRHDIGPHGVLELRTVSGTIRLSATDGEDAVVTVRGDKDALRDLAVEREPGRLLVQPIKIDAGWFKRSNVEFDFDVVVPRSARVDIKAVSADVIASGLMGEQTFKTVSGDVHLAGGGGRISVQSVSGDLHVNGAKQIELQRYHHVGRRARRCPDARTRAGKDGQRRRAPGRAAVRRATPHR